MALNTAMVQAPVLDLHHFAKMPYDVKYLIMEATIESRMIQITQFPLEGKNSLELNDECNIVVPKFEALTAMSDSRRQALRGMRPLIVTKTMRVNDQCEHLRRIEQISPTSDILFFESFVAYMLASVVFHSPLQEFESIIIGFDSWDAELFNINEFDEIKMLFPYLRRLVIVYDTVGHVDHLDDAKKFKLFSFNDEFRDFVWLYKYGGELDPQDHFQADFASHLMNAKQLEIKVQELQHHSTRAPLDLVVDVLGIARERIQFPGEYVHRWGPKFFRDWPRICEDKFEAYIKHFLAG